MPKKRTNPEDEVVTQVESEEVQQSEENKQPATKADINGLRDAVQALTKIVGENIKENVKWFRAGKM